MLVGAVAGAFVGVRVDGSLWLPAVIQRQPFPVSARSSATQAPISVSGCVMMWNESWW